MSWFFAVQEILIQETSFHAGYVLCVLQMAHPFMIFGAKTGFFQITSIFIKFACFYQ